MIVVNHRSYPDRRPVETVWGGGELETAVHVPAEGIALRRDGMFGTPVDHADAKLNRAGAVEHTGRAFPPDAVVGFHVADDRARHRIALGTAVPDAETPGLGILHYGHVGLKTAVFLAGHDGVGDIRLAFGSIDDAFDVI
ncbi:MAG: hypothetical protein U9Q79_08420 [Candidatus Hydrogenedentes bacterium]|nr:hypothetical protein [Candidatus Hydrogenedentota bacterium]